MTCMGNLKCFLANQRIQATTRYFAQTSRGRQLCICFPENLHVSCISEDARYDSLSCDSTSSASPVHEMYKKPNLSPSKSKHTSYEPLFCEYKSW